MYVEVTDLLKKNSKRDNSNITILHVDRSAPKKLKIIS